MDRGGKDARVPVGTLPILLMRADCPFEGSRPAHGEPHRGDCPWGPLRPPAPLRPLSAESPREIRAVARGHHLLPPAVLDCT
eukprot:815443-Pyramimonas_sp.AAC.1